MTQAQFRTRSATRCPACRTATANLQIDVESYSNFSSASYPAALTAQNTLNPTLDNYSTGSVCSVVLLRTFYVWPVATPV